MFRRNNNVASQRGKLELLIIFIGVVPFGKKSNIKLGKIIIQVLSLFFVYKLVFIRTRSSPREFNIRHFRSNLVWFGFVSFVYIVYSFVNCLSRAVGLEIKVIS